MLRCVVALIRGGVDKSLARLTSPCRRTESIVSLERGVCSFAELQLFSCYRGWKEAWQAMRAISTTWRRELSSRFFFFLHGKAPKEIHAFLTETLGENAPSYATVKNWASHVSGLGPSFMRIWACGISPRSGSRNAWIWSLISGMVTVLGRPGRGATPVEKSQRLN